VVKKYEVIVIGKDIFDKWGNQLKLEKLIEENNPVEQEIKVIQDSDEEK